MKISIKDIAEKANVSKATVSRVINDKDNVSDETREKIKEIIKELGYSPDERARNLSLGLNNNIALIVPSDNPLYINIIKEINTRLFENNMSLLFYITDHNPELEEDLIGKLKNKSIGGVIYVKSPETNFNNMSNLNKLDVPVVIVSDDETNNEYDHIHYSEERISSKCVEILIKENHEEIAYLCTPLKLNYEKKRYQGIINTLQEFGKEIDMTDFYFVNDITIEESCSIAKEIIDKDYYTAIYTSSNILAMGVLKAYKDRNMPVEDNISLVSHGDLSYYNKIGYNITTVSIPVHEVSELAVELLLERIKNPEGQRKNIELNLAPELKGSEKLIKS